MEHYGLERSAMVATVPTFRARSAVRELTWVRGYPTERIEALAEFHYLRGSQIEEALASLPELAESPLNEEQEVLAIASQFDGLPCNLSVHLGGVVIADDLLSIAPVEMSAKGFPVVQFDKDDVGRHRWPPGLTGAAEAGDAYAAPGLVQSHLALCAVSFGTPGLLAALWLGGLAVDAAGVTVRARSGR